MYKQMSKAEVLDALRQEHAHLEDAITGLSDEQMLQTGIYEDNQWTVKDILAHITAWEQLMVGWLAARREGRAPHPPAQVMWQDTDGMNTRYYARDKDLPLDEVKTNFATSYQQALAEVDALTEEEIGSGHPFDATTDQPLLPHITLNTSEHYADHAAAIRAWRERASI